MATVVLGPLSIGDNAGGVRPNYGQVTAAINGTLGSADVIDIRGYRFIAVQPPAGVTGADVYAAESAAGTFVLVDSIGTNGTIALVASKWNVLDATKIGPFGFIKLKSAGANGNAIIVGKT